MPVANKVTVANLLADQAVAHDATVLARIGDTLSVVVRLQRSGGKVVPYKLQIETDGGEPRVREQAPERLPTLCPNRHLNEDGYFCLSFRSEDPLPVLNADDAQAWWARLLKYLNLQETTSKLRRWPSQREWAHGVAAIHQSRAERCAAALGPRYVEALDRRSLSAKRSGASFIRLYDGDTRLYSVWSNPPRVATLRQSCVCGSGFPLVACADHAERAAELPFALLDWAKEETRFWQSIGGRTCCGTLDDCPLRKATITLAANDEPPAQAA